MAAMVTKKEQDGDSTMYGNAVWWFDGCSSHDFNITSLTAEGLSLIWLLSLGSGTRQTLVFLYLLASVCILFFLLAEKCLDIQDSLEGSIFWDDVCFLNFFFHCLNSRLTGCVQITYGLMCALPCILPLQISPCGSSWLRLAGWGATTQAPK